MKKLNLLFLLVVLFVPVTGQENETLLVSKNGAVILPEKGDFAIGIDAVPFLNLFNDKGDEPGFNFITSFPAISGKYFMSDKSALRSTVRIRYRNSKDGDIDLTNYTKNTNTDLYFGLGYERRIGKSRVQGLYGLEYNITGSKTKSTQDDSVFDDRSSLGTGINGFAGAEYFVLPKLSVGGQFSWGISYSVSKDKEREEKARTFNMDAGNMGGALMLTFHF